MQTQFGKKRWAARLGMLALALAASLPDAEAQSRIVREGRAWVEEQTGDLPASRAVRVQADLGTVTVETGAPSLRYIVRKRSYSGSEQEARRWFDTFRASSGRERDWAVLRLAGGQGRFRGRRNVEIVLQVPRDLAHVRVDTRAGNITVQPTSAKLQLATMGGNINITEAGSFARAETMGGNVVVGNARGDVSVKSGGGNISLGNVAGRVDVAGMGGNVSIQSLAGGTVQTAGGSVTVVRCGGDLIVKTAGGTITLGEIAGAAKAETGGGNIRVGSARGPVIAVTGGGNIELWKLHRGAQVQTGAGAITAEFLGGKGGFGESYLRTSAGDVLVYLSSKLPATVSAASEMCSGRGIRSDFPELRITSEGGDYGPKSMYAEGTLNGGGPALKVRTTIGQIEFRRAK